MNSHGMRRAVVPLVRAGRAVVDELVADRLPRLAAVVRSLNQLAEPAGALRRVEAVRIGGRAFEVVHLPAAEERAAARPNWSRLPSDSRMNAPLRVPTSTRTPLMPCSCRGQAPSTSRQHSTGVFLSAHGPHPRSLALGGSQRLARAAGASLIFPQRDNGIDRRGAAGRQIRGSGRGGAEHGRHGGDGGGILRDRCRRASTRHDRMTATASGTPMASPKPKSDERFAQEHPLDRRRATPRPQCARRSRGGGGSRCRRARRRARSRQSAGRATERARHVGDEPLDEQAAVDDLARTARSCVSLTLRSIALGGGGSCGTPALAGSPDGTNRKPHDGRPALLRVRAGSTSAAGRCAQADPLRASCTTPTISIGCRDRDPPSW